MPFPHCVIFTKGEDSIIQEISIVNKFERLTELTTAFTKWGILIKEDSQLIVNDLLNNLNE